MYHLYKIEPYFANVVDPMHTILLNLIRNVINECFYDKDLAGNPTRIPFNKAEFMQRLKRFPWTAEQKAGRVPQSANMKKSHLGYWKGMSFSQKRSPIMKHPFTRTTAQEWQLLMWPAGEVLFKGVVPNDVYNDLFLPLIRTVELVFGSSRTSGWGSDHVKEYHSLGIRIGLGYQKYLGPDKCSISVFNNIQIAADSESYGHPHNVWCFAGERIVRYYKSIPHNQKNFEISMARGFARREATRFWLSRQQNICAVDPDGAVDSEKEEEDPGDDSEDEVQLQGPEEGHPVSDELLVASSSPTQHEMNAGKLIVVSFCNARL